MSPTLFPSVRATKTKCGYRLREICSAILLIIYLIVNVLPYSFPLGFPRLGRGPRVTRKFLGLRLVRPYGPADLLMKTVSQKAEKRVAPRTKHVVRDAAE